MYEATGKYGVGDVIRYSPFGGGIRRVRVDGVEADIKNGRPGFTGVVLDESGNPVPSEMPEFQGPHFLAWGYDDQIVGFGL